MLETCTEFQYSICFLGGVIPGKYVLACSCSDEHCPEIAKSPDSCSLQNINSSFICPYTKMSSSGI